jgi:DNA-binding transcriptional regulator YiaG
MVRTSQGKRRVIAGSPRLTVTAKRSFRHGIRRQKETGRRSQVFMESFVIAKVRYAMRRPIPTIPLKYQGQPMPNIAALLKSEITRLSRKEIRNEVRPLRKATASYRREIATLKRAIASLERQAKQMAKRAPAPQSASDASDEKPTRFVAKGLLALRKRLALSAPQLARLLGVSTQSVYNWEHKKAVPRKEQIAAIVALRPVGKKEVHQRLDALARPAKRKTAKRKTAKRKRSRA